MFNTIYILQWENYYDRRVHPYVTELENQGLGLYMEIDTAGFQGVNFNPNDGVNTSVVLNLQELQQGNYLIVLDDENRVISRWFIIDSIRTRGGQYQLNLRRDLITDYWNVIRQSPALIEKCSLSYDNPLIFNNEDMTFNQIKTSETLLKDRSGCAWLVGYYDRNKLSEMNGTVPTNDIISGAIQLNEDIENWEYYKYSNFSATNENFLGQPTVLEYGIRTLGILGDGKKTSALWYYIRSQNGSVGHSFEAWSVEPSLRSKTPTRDTTIAQITTAVTANNNSYLNTMNSLADSYAPITTESDFEEFMSFQGATVRDAQGRYYQINITENTGVYKNNYDVPAGSLYNTMSSVVNEVSGIYGTINASSFFIHLECPTYKINLSRIEAFETKYNFAEGILNTLDAPWNVFAMPYVTDTPLTIKNALAGSVLAVNSNSLYINAAMAMQLQHPGVIYDIQLLPYCPVPGLIERDNEIELFDTNEFTTITAGENNTVVGYIFHASASQFSVDLLDYSIKKANSAIERKINNECDKWRLCSPNYSNYFDFGVEKNNGIQYFNVDCHYKPFSPYIHVNPNFGGLYGYDDNSPRGLICGGDFSLSQVIDNWEQYQIQNKNFQAIFDRQIQNMEITNKYQKTMEIATAITGTVSGGVAGAGTGLIASGGNPYAAIGGAVVGTAASAAGGIADVMIKDKLRNETLDYTKDLFGYQLGNVQALPLTISKVSAFNNNNKIFPILEYYTCKDIEKEALAYKLAYNGMTTMVISDIDSMSGNSWEYEINNKIIKSQNYIKARPIQLRMGDDFHIANEIAMELNKGFYIVSEDEE